MTAPEFNSGEAFGEARYKVYPNSEDAQGRNSPLFSLYTSCTPCNSRSYVPIALSGTRCTH